MIQINNSLKNEVDLNNIMFYFFSNFGVKIIDILCINYECIF